MAPASVLRSAGDEWVDGSDVGDDTLKERVGDLVNAGSDDDGTLDGLDEEMLTGPDDELAGNCGDI